MPHTLLLADDSVTIQRVIELTFADEDVKVVAVSDGDQAIERLEASPPDIVLADIGMPGKNGYEVAKYVKQSPRLSHIPVVLLTGAFEPVDQARAAEAGCDGVLAKPFEPQMVIGRVKELLAKARPVPSSLDAELAPPPSMPPDRWTAPGVDQAFAPPPAAPPTTESLDDYFDRLDAAFETMSRPTAPAAGQVVQKPAEAAAEPAPDIDWFSSLSESSAPANEPWDLPAPDPALISPEAPDLSLSYGESPSEPSDQSEPSHPSGFDEVAEVPAEDYGAAATAAAGREETASYFPAPAPHAAQAPAPAPPEPARIAALPSLADAFAALLAAEQDEPAPPAVPLWPAQGPSTAELVDQITRRVLAQLSDTVVRQTVADLVSQIAERLVQEEIERIKASIK